MGKGLCACIEVLHRVAEGRKLKTGPLNLDVEMLNFQNHAGFDVISVVVHRCGA